MKLVQTIPQSATQTAPFAQGSQGWGMWCRFSLRKGAKVGRLCRQLFRKGAMKWKEAAAFCIKGGKRGAFCRVFLLFAGYTRIYIKNFCIFLSQKVEKFFAIYYNIDRKSEGGAVRLARASREVEKL